MKLLTASRSALLMSGCNAWLRDDSVWTDQGSDAATAGSQRHALLQSAVDGSDPGEVTDEACNAADAFAPLLEEVSAQGEAIAELAIAYHPETGEAIELGRGIGRDYSKCPPGWIAGSFDLVVVRDSSKGGPDLIICDWKSWHQGAQVDASDQLRTGALMAARLFGAATVEIRTGLVGELEAHWADVETLDADDLDQIAEERQEYLARAALGVDPPVPGPHCSQRYCPARASCSVASGACDALVAPEPPHRLSLEIISNDHAVWSLAALKLVEARAKEIKAKVLAYCDEHGGLTGPDGRIYSSKEMTTEKPNLERADVVAEIRAAGAEKAFRLSTSWTAIAKEIGTKPAEALRSTLREMGGVKTSTRPDYDWRQTDEQKAAKKARKPRGAA